MGVDRAFELGQVDYKSPLTQRNIFLFWYLDYISALFLYQETWLEFLNKPATLLDGVIKERLAEEG